MIDNTSAPYGILALRVTTGALFLFQRRLLGLELADEVGDVGGVGLPEQRHGGFAGENQQLDSDRLSTRPDFVLLFRKY